MICYAAAHASWRQRILVPEQLLMLMLLMLQGSRR
jgi:hypothetical protein